MCAAMPVLWLKLMRVAPHESTHCHMHLTQDDPRFQLADPICTFVFALLVLWTTRMILQDISDILMERVPRNLDVAAIQTQLLQVT